MIGVETAATAVKYGVPALQWTWDNRSKVRKAVDGVRRWFAKKSRILILGAGGTGKSTLARMITGGFDWLHDNPWEYGQSLTAEQLTLKDHRTVEVLVLPGQKQRHVREWPKVATSLAAGKYSGVIYVTAFGYHSPADQALKDITGETTKEKALVEYLKRKREDELEVFRQLAEVIELCPKKLWLLSVIAKQDLWCDEEQEVQRHYRTGEHSAGVERLLQKKGTGDFAHEIVFGSLLIANMTEPSGAVAKKAVAGYDHRRQVESFRHLIELFDGLR